MKRYLPVYCGDVCKENEWPLDIGEPSCGCPGDDESLGRLLWARCEFFDGIDNVLHNKETYIQVDVDTLKVGQRVCYKDNVWRTCVCREKGSELGVVREDGKTGVIPISDLKLPEMEDFKKMAEEAGETTKEIIFVCNSLRAAQSTKGIYELEMVVRSSDKRVFWIEKLWRSFGPKMITAAKILIHQALAAQKRHFPDKQLQIEIVGRSESQALAEFRRVLAVCFPDENTNESQALAVRRLLTVCFPDKHTDEGTGAGAVFTAIMA